MVDALGKVGVSTEAVVLILALTRRPAALWLMFSSTLEFAHCRWTTEIGRGVGGLHLNSCVAPELTTAIRTAGTDRAAYTSAPQ